MNEEIFQLSFEKQFVLRNFEDALKGCIKTNMTEQEVKALIKEIVNLYRQNIIKDNLISSMIKNGVL